MKKSLLVFGAALSTTISFGQITVGEWDVVSPGDQVTQNTDTLPTVIFPAAGTDMTWDLAGLNNHEQYIMNFAAPGWLNNSAYYPESNLAAVDANGFEIYMTKDSQGLRNVGFAGDLFGTGDRQVYMEPGDEMIQFPANHGDSYISNSTQSISFPGSDIGFPVDSIVNKTITEKHIDVDGWGTVTTPYGTFEVIRLNQVSYSVDSTWSYLFGTGDLVDDGADTSYSVSFWSNDPGTGFPLVELEHDNAGAVLSVDWLAGAPVASLKENTSSAASVYPNPANDELNINVDGATDATFVMYDLNGKEVMSTVVSSTSAVNVSGIKEGLYVYKVISNNAELKTGKITIKH